MRPVLVVASELMIGVRLEGILRATGCPVRVVDPDAAAVAAAMAGERPEVAVLDLTAPEAVRQALMLQARATGAAVIAFGPHTDAALLAAARAEGAAEVLPRSALAHGLAPLVAKHLARAHPSDIPDGPPA
jgi:DNA-binding NtrC family response regulator